MKAKKTVGKWLMLYADCGLIAAALVFVTWATDWYLRLQRVRPDDLTYQALIPVVAIFIIGFIILVFRSLYPTFHPFLSAALGTPEKRKESEVESETKEDVKQKKALSEEKTPLERQKARLEEYHQLTSSLWNRARDHVTLQSILISGSLLAVTIVIRNISEIEKLMASVVLIGAMLLTFLSGVNFYTTRKVNEIFWDRVHKLEKQLEIEVGNRGLYEKHIKCTGWYYWRRNIWAFILVILFIMYLAALLRTLTLP